MNSAVCHIHFAHPGRDPKYVSGYSMHIIRLAGSRAGVTSSWITSTYRSEEEQARVMLSNLKPGPGSMYAGAGRRVEAIGKRFAVERALHQRSHQHGFDSKPASYTLKEDEVRSLMALKIHDLERHKGVGCVSHHQIDPQILNVIDIDPYVVPNGNLIAFIKELTLSPGVSRVGLPGGVNAFSDKHFRESVRCLHVEIPQPGDFNKGTGAVA
jgi:hypothetical protein